MGRTVIYLDANVAIRLVQGNWEVRAPLETRLANLIGVPRSVLTSRLTRLECRAKPLRLSDDALLSSYELFFNGSELVMAELSADVVELATDLRARYRFKTPDSLHLATAILGGATAFLTGDRDLARCTEVLVEVY